MYPVPVMNFALPPNLSVTPVPSPYPKTAPPAIKFESVLILPPTTSSCSPGLVVPIPTLPKSFIYKLVTSDAFLIQSDDVDELEPDPTISSFEVGAVVPTPTYPRVSST